MAGGIFITQNKIRPGFYHQFIAKAAEKQLFGELGVAALPLELDWGADKTIIELDADGMDYEFQYAIGYSRDEVLPVREVLKRARKLLVYRVNGDGTKAQLQMNPGQPVTVTARCAGIRGNDIAVQIDEDDDNAGYYKVVTYVNSITQVEQEGVQNVEEIEDNDWVTFSGSGAISSAAGGNLTGGTNGTATDDDYSQFLKTLEGYEFNAYGLPKNETALKEMFAAASKRFVEEQGKLVQCILPDYNAGYEAVISLQNGVILTDGTVLAKEDAVAWFTGMASAAGPATSMTYMEYDGAKEPDTRLDDAQIKAAIKAGQIVFVAQKNSLGDEVAVVEQDINTLIRYTQNRPKVWSKNRVVRALYYLVSSLTRVWHLYYIGKVDNNEAGRNLFKADLAIMMRQLVEMGAYENFDAETDISVEKGADSDAVVAQLAVQPVDAMEKMYFTVELQ